MSDHPTPLEKVMDSLNIRNEIITFEQISQCFDLPLHQASIKLGLEKKEITRICKENNVKRWPYSYKKNMFAKSYSKESKDLFTVFKVDAPKQIGWNSPQPVVKGDKTTPHTKFDKLDLKNLLNNGK